MRYKVGDKIEVKTWKELEKEFGLDNYGKIKTDRLFSPIAEETIKKANTNRIFTIKEFYNYKEDPYFEFRVEEILSIIGMQWVKNAPEPEYYNRFELLDL